MVTMMRYQRVSPDFLPLPNGKKPTSSAVDNGRSIPNGVGSSSTGYEIKGFRYRSPSRTQDFPNHSSSNGVAVGSPSRSDNGPNQSHKREASPPSRGGSGDMLVQWGQKKRARVSRSEIRALADESSSSGQHHVASKVPRRLDDSKLPAPAMPPAPGTQHPPQSSTKGKGGHLRKEAAALLSHRNLEKRSAGNNGSPSRTSGGGGAGSRLVSRSTTVGKRSPTPDKADKKAQRQQQQTTSRSSRDEKLNGSAAAAALLHHPHQAAAAAADHHHGHGHGHGRHAESTSGQLEHEGSRGGAAVHNNTVPQVVEWPRIFLSLSRKEKEDDFLVMKGTKLPQRPKKRAKTVDRGLQYCYPGMWLSDLTKSRYEVREKKSAKKQQQKRRGLKGMDSESE